MKSYDEVAQSVFKRRKKYLKKRSKRRKIIISAAIPTVCVCIVLATCFALWKNGLFKNIILPLNSGASQESYTDASESALQESRPSDTSSDTASDDVPAKVSTETVKIDSLDKLNFYAVKKVIAENGDVLLTDMSEKPKITPLSGRGNSEFKGLANSVSKDITAKSTFTVTMCIYFTVTLNDADGFLAEKLGGTGLAEVVVTANNYSNIITFKKGDRYYSCLQTAVNDKSMTFSSLNYVKGFKLFENSNKENYEYTVYYESDKVTGIKCGRIKGDGNYKYKEDAIKLNGNFCIVLHKKQSFTVEQLEKLFENHNLFVDDGVVLHDGTVLFGESSVTDNEISFKNSSGAQVIANKDIKKISGMYSSAFGYCIRLELSHPDKISSKIKLAFYNEGHKDRDLTLRKNGSAVYISDLNNKSRMSDIFYKLTAVNTGNKIGRISNHDDFVREISKKADLNNYSLSVDDYSDVYNGTLIDYKYNLNENKSAGSRVSNYDITIDDITITMPIKVSDLISKGFTSTNRDFDNNLLKGTCDFITPKGNEFRGTIMNFYGNSTRFDDCYVTQISFDCYDNSDAYQKGISPARPDFDMIEGINKNSTFDDIVSRLGEPNKIHLHISEDAPVNYKYVFIQIEYNVYTPELPDGRLVFNIYPILNNGTATDFLQSAEFCCNSRD